jgi:tetratricopeptide (TPR) repeat protein
MSKFGSLRCVVLLVLGTVLSPALTSCSGEKSATPPKKDEPDKLITEFTEAIQRNSGDANAYYKRGLRYDELGEPDKAIADYTEAIRLKDVRPFSNRAAAYQMKREFTKAIADYTEVIELNTKSKKVLEPGDVMLRAGVAAKAYYGRGVCYDGKGEPDKAVADYKEADQLDPKLLNDDLRKRIGK